MEFNNIMDTNQGYAPSWLESQQPSEDVYLTDLEYQNADYIDLLASSSHMESFMELDSIEEVKEEEEEEKGEEMKAALSNLLPDLLTQVGINNNGAVNTSSSCSTEDTTQSLIEEVETYLQSVSGGVSTSSLQESWTSDLPHKKEEKVDEADRIFEALTTGNVVQQAEEDLNLEEALSTSVISADGENVIIILAPSPPPPTTTDEIIPAAPSPAPSFTLPTSPSYDALSPAQSDTDAEWSPANLSRTVMAATKPRKKYERKVRAKPPTGPYPVEKKARKMAQNRSAAFKYRERKKAEQDAVDEELDRLFDRNAYLKKKMSEMEIQVRLIKQLMTETMGIDIPDGLLR